MGQKGKGGKKGKSGRYSKPPGTREFLERILPIEELFEEEEMKIYKSYVSAYMEDFKDEDLTANDMDDIMTLSINKVQEFRLLKKAKGSPEELMDISTSLEKLKKQSEKLKESLSTRRKDRIDPNKYKGFSIVDLAISFDDEKKRKYENRIQRNKKEEIDMKIKRENYSGNRYDADVKEVDREDELV